MPNILSPSRTDTAFQWLARGCGIIATGIVVLITLFLIVETIPALTQIGPSRFFTDSSWHPAPNPSAGTFNLVPMIAGTLLATIGAVMLATPLGIFSAIFCNYYAPKHVARAYRHLITLLAGIPSVVYGFWGMIALVPVIRQIQAPGPSLLAGVLILTIMILPTIALTADAALAAVPRNQLNAAAALALSRPTTIRTVAFPAARSGLATGIILATGRAIGETMAILMVCGNIVQTPASIYDPIRTLTANIALEMAYAVDAHRSALFATGLTLMCLVILLVTTHHQIERRYAHA